MGLWLLRFSDKGERGNAERLDAEAKFHAQWASARVQVETLRAERWLVEPVRRSRPAWTPF